MSHGDALRNLATLVDAVEASDAEVVDATPDTVHDDGRCTATITVEIPADGIGEGWVQTATDDIDASDAPTGGGDATRTPDSAPIDTAPSPADADTEAGGDQIATDVDASRDTADAAAASGDGEAAAASGDGEAAAASGDGEAAESPDAADGSESVRCTAADCDATFGTEHGMRIHRSKAHDDAGSPRDPERLETVYERQSSFEAMREALDADVSAQTVRRWMMAAGIHSIDDADDADESAEEAEPGNATDGGDGAEPDVPADADEPTEPPDDDVDGDDSTDPSTADRPSLPTVEASLPDGVTTDRLRAAVEDAATLYDVQQALGLDRERTRAVLAEYDLLELVHGRVADRPEREALKAEIDDRLLANADRADSTSD